MHTYDYAVVRVVPRVDRGEFINAGVVLCCAPRQVLVAGIELDAARLLALDSRADIQTMKAALAAIPRICAGGPAAGVLGRLSVRERFDWLVAPRSSSVQMSPVHTGWCADDVDVTLQRLMAAMVLPPA
jgi:hypothetical protein